MSDLAQAAGSGVTEEVAGKTIEMAPINLKDMGQLERQALQSFKREFIQTYTANVDLLPPEESSGIVQRAFEDASRFDLETLPSKEMTMPVKNPDGSTVTDKEGEPVSKKQSVPYTAWWSSLTFDGMLHSVWISMKKANPKLTLDEAADMINSDPDPQKLNALAQTVDEISGADLVGNLPAPLKEAAIA